MCPRVQLMCLSWWRCLSKLGLHTGKHPWFINTLPLTGRLQLVLVEITWRKIGTVHNWKSYLHLLRVTPIISWLSVSLWVGKIYTHRTLYLSFGLGKFSHDQLFVVSATTRLYASWSKPQGGCFIVYHFGVCLEFDCEVMLGKSWDSHQVGGLCKNA